MGFGRSAISPSGRQRSDFMSFQTSTISFVLPPCRYCRSVRSQARRRVRHARLCTGMALTPAGTRLPFSWQSLTCNPLTDREILKS
jgi:hypothetical protein